MSESATKSVLPAYVSFAAFTNFLNKLRDTGVPSRIDRSVMGSASGSLISSVLAALRSFELIDEAQRPREAMRTLVTASDEGRKEIFKQLFERGYSFLQGDPDFHLETATTAQLTQKFRDQGMSGSTVTKSIAFFLALAKAADIKVSPHMKAPPAPKTNGKASRKPVKASPTRELENDPDSVPEAEEGDNEDVERFEIPIPHKPSVRVIVPRDLDADDWEMLQNMITVYIKRWKGFKASKETQE
ncbi:DUF5343 domain-containing protein [Achromobacter xylosoxidans]|uniref:DUF5343 domain-containing protein n=1 Tax=Alcaligenes xylosoxydans xylosoxydans TaxID=85698 RepID=UPI001EEC446E|nr:MULTISPECIES: DUF5343 domain-containing protein [Achromobacter]